VSVDSWVVTTDEKQVRGMVAAARHLGGPVTAVVVGSRALADAVAATGPDAVRWVSVAPDVPPEACAAAVADLAAADPPRVLVSSTEPAARVLLGAVAARIGAAVVPGMLDLAAPDGDVVVSRAALGGEVIETLVVGGPVATVFVGDDVESGAPAAVDVVEQAAVAADARIEGTEPVGSATGVADAARVVSFGRGVRAKADVALLRQLADVLGAELACSMPIADDLGWLEKERYVGRSGQHIAPRLYLAVGIGGAPQHLEGVRDAKVVAAVNNDPDARIFRSVDYGIVGDLYEVVPALIDALSQ
jgi:electron transfer flavoprotein alpha subunit